MKQPGRTVLDSCALLAFLFKERGHEKVVKLLEWALDNNARHLMTTVNWAEVCYISQRRLGHENSRKAQESLLSLPLDVVPCSREIAELAASFKARGGISLCDCFAAALAKQEGLPVCTGDSEFKQVEKDLDIIWI